MKSQEEISADIRAVFAEFSGRFRPSAFFDARLDCIRVIAKDCSFLETRINEHLTVLEDLYAGESEPSPYVGFTIKGARHFCHANGLSLDAPIQVSLLLDKILKAFPGVLVEVFVNGIARPLVKNGGIEQVEVSPVPGGLLQTA